jgi:cob(I)alamin adenosyltransferase
VSITTKRGDQGQTSLPGGCRVSKGDLRIECYGGIDELISQLGFARSICEHQDIAAQIKSIQQDLFRVAAAIGTPKDASVSAPEITKTMVDALENEVHKIEVMPGILGDWSIPGESVASAALDVARTVCRRAERLTVNLSESQALSFPNVIPYLNRLSDLLWLMGRLVEIRSGVDSSLRPKDQPGKPWSQAW